MTKWHRHLGVYGICLDKDKRKILLIKKSAGPYRGRYDLPGGTVEPLESLTEAVKREFIEETNLPVEIIKNIGTFDFLIRHPHKDTTHTHHIAIFYEVGLINQNDLFLVTNQVSSDSNGSEWVDVELLCSEWISPLVQKAVKWIKSGKISNEIEIYEEWTSKDDSIKAT